MPLADAFVADGSTVDFATLRTEKHTSPHLYTGLKTMLEDREIGCRDLSTVRTSDAIVTVEGSGLLSLNGSALSGRIVSISFMTDFSALYEAYSTIADLIVFPGTYIPSLFGKIDGQNWCHGSPKYDVKLSRQAMREKYALDGSVPVACVLAPKRRDMRAIDLRAVYDALRLRGYTIVVKSRKKDSVDQGWMRGDLYCEDDQWFPHESMELICAADVVVQFGSTAIKETLMLGTPTINIDVKEKNLLVDMCTIDGFSWNISVPEQIDPIIAWLEHSSPDQRQMIVASARKKFMYDRRPCSSMLMNDISR